MEYSALSSVEFVRSVRIPLPTGGYTDVRRLAVPEHALGFFGTCDLGADLAARVVRIRLQSSTSHLTVWVPMEQVGSYVVFPD